MSDSTIAKLFNEASEVRFYPLSLASDIAIACLIIVLITAVFEIWRRHRKRVFQFGVSELLAAIAICGICFGWWRSAMQRHTENQTAIAAIERIGGRVIVEPGHPDWLPEIVHQYFEIFDRPLIANCGDGGSWCGVYVVSVMQQNAGVGDTELAPLGTLKSLTEVDLGYTQLTDAGLGALGSLKQLEELSLKGTKITDGAVDQLTRYRALKRLDIRGTELSKEAIQKIRCSLPACSLITTEEAQ